MSAVLLRGAAEQGLIYSLVALALYLSYRTLNIADLTVDGSFTLGAAAGAMLTSLGHPVLGLFAAAAAGVLAGMVTALLQTELKVQPILAGIITMTALYSINLRVMGNRSNLPLLRVETVYTLFAAALPETLRPWGKFLLSLLITAAVSASLFFFLRTRLGLSVRATGDNRTMVSASSINPAFTTTEGPGAGPMHGRSLGGNGSPSIRCFRRSRWAPAWWSSGGLADHRRGDRRSFRPLARRGIGNPRRDPRRGRLPDHYRHGAFGFGFNLRPQAGFGADRHCGDLLSRCPRPLPALPAEKGGPARC